jgi:DNA-binding MarR family transcriptional regulator
VTLENSRSKAWDFFHALKTEMFKAWAPVLQSLGLTEIQAAILIEIESGNSCTVGQLAERLNANQGNFSSLCKKMEQMGLIVRSRSREDERVVTPELTSLGKEKAREIHDALDKMFRTNATPEQTEIIIRGYEEALNLFKKINNKGEYHC